MISSKDTKLVHRHLGKLEKGALSLIGNLAPPKSWNKEVLSKMRKGFQECRDSLRKAANNSAGFHILTDNFMEVSSKTLKLMPAAMKRLHMGLGTTPELITCNYVGPHVDESIYSRAEEVDQTMELHWIIRNPSGKRVLGFNKTGTELSPGRVVSSAGRVGDLYLINIRNLHALGAPRLIKRISREKLGEPISILSVRLTKVNMALLIPRFCEFGRNGSGVKGGTGKS